MIRIIDTLGMLGTLWLVVRPFIYPDDPTWLAAIATIVCFWIAVRTVAICSCGRQLWPAPAMIFLLLSMITNHLGAYVHYKVGWGIMVEQSAAWNMIWAFNLAYLAVAAGVYVFYRASGINMEQLIRKYYAVPVHLPPEQRALILPSLVFLMLGIAAAIILLGGRLPILDVFRLLSGGGFDEAKLTAYAAREFLSTASTYRGQGYLDQMRIAVLPMMLIFWIIIQRHHPSIWLRWLFWAALGATVVTMIAGLERAPLILFIIQIAIVMMTVVKPKPSIRWLYGLAGTFVLFLGMTVFLGRGLIGATFIENVLVKFSSVINRIYLSNSMSSVKAFELFPDHLPFRHGQTWLQDIANILPGPGRGLSAEIYEYLWGGPGAAGVHFIAEMWVNGGFIVVLVASFLFGLFAQFVNQKILGLKQRTPLHLTYYGLVLFCFGLLGYGGFMTPVNRGLITFTALFGILLLLSNIARKIADDKGPTGTAIASVGIAQPVQGKGQGT